MGRFGKYAALVHHSSLVDCAILYSQPQDSAHWSCDCLRRFDGREAGERKERVAFVDDREGAKQRPENDIEDCIIAK